MGLLDAWYSNRIYRTTEAMLMPVLTLLEKHNWDKSEIIMSNIVYQDRRQVGPQWKIITWLSLLHSMRCIFPVISVTVENTPLEEDPILEFRLRYLKVDLKLICFYETESRPSVPTGSASSYQLRHACVYKKQALLCSFYEICPLHSERDMYWNRFIYRFLRPFPSLVLTVLERMVYIGL